MASGQKQNDGPGDEIVFEAPGLEPEELIERGAAVLRSFVQVPNSAIFDRRLSGDEYRLYSALRHYARRSDRCWPGQAKLAADLGVKERAIRRWLKGLRDAGYLSWSKRFGTTNVYVIRHVPIPPAAAPIVPIRSDGTGLENDAQSGLQRPLNPVSRDRSIRSPETAQSGLTGPTEEEAVEEYAEEEHADGIPPSAGKLADANFRPAASGSQSPEGGSAPQPPTAEGRGAASPQQASFLEQPPSRRRRAAAAGAGEGPGNWVAEFSAVHRERCGGEFSNFALAGQKLKPLREQHGHELLLAAWRLYVVGTEVKWIRVNDFAAKPKPWLDKAQAAAGGASAPKPSAAAPPRTKQELIEKWTRGRAA